MNMKIAVLTLMASIMCLAWPERVRAGDALSAFPQMTGAAIDRTASIIPCPPGAPVVFTIRGTVLGGRAKNKKKRHHNKPTAATKSPTAAIKGSSVILDLASVQGFPPFPGVDTATTDSHGKFEMDFCNAPQPGAVLYLVAQRGDAGGGTNSAIQLLSILGVAQYPPAQPFPSNTIKATVNELTTVAAAYLASNFINTATGFCTTAGETNICDSCVPNGTTTCVNGPLPTAVQAIGNLVDVRLGALGSVIDNVNNDPSLIDTIANALANCVDATPSSPACTSLFSATSSSDTLGAVINLAKSPVNTSIFGLGTSGPYLPVLAAAPSGWTLWLNYIGGGLNKPSAVAVDGPGNIWVANSGNNSITELNPSGVPVSSSGFTGGGLSAPSALAIAPADGNIWVANSGNNSVTELSSTGSPLSTTGFTGGGLNTPDAIAIDGPGNIWIANQGNNSVTQLNPASRPPSLSNFTGGGLNAPKGIAADSSGNIWVANSGNDSLSGLNSLGIFLSTGAGFTGGGLSTPNAIVAGGACHQWVTNASDVSEFASDGSPVSSSGFTGGGLNGPAGIARDGANHFWIANQTGNSVTELDSLGAALSPIGFSVAGLNGPKGIAIDSAGNVWLANVTGDSVTELLGAAAAVATPLMPPSQSSCLAPPAPTTISTPTSSSPTSMFGQAITFTATVTATIGGTPTGTVNFFDEANLIGSSVLNASGQASLTTSTLVVGVHMITASYSGDASFAPSPPSTPLSQTVTPAATTTSLTSSSPTGSTFGQAVTFTATITPSSLAGVAATGTVTFNIDGTATAPVPLSSGMAAFNISTLTGGVHTITASYSGDANFAPSSTALSQTVTLAATTTSLTSLSPTGSTFGQAVIFTATITPSSLAGVAATGTVTFNIDGTATATVPLSGGMTVFSISTLSVGAHTITASYSGDMNFAPSTSAPLSQVISKASTTTSLKSSSNPATFGQAVTFTATITPSSLAGVAATGTVTFNIDGTAQSPVPLGGGQASLPPISTLSVGKHTITASYSGDANFAPSSAAPLSQTVNSASACLPSSSLSVLVQGRNVSSYVPKGNWESSTSGVSVVQVEGTGITPATITTPSVVNSCSSNSVTGQTVCVANDTDVYLITGSTLSAMLTSGATGTASFSGGNCMNCGVTFNSTTNQALIGMGLTTGAGYQFLDLAPSTPTFETAFPSASTGKQISEDLAIDPGLNLILSPAEDDNYEIVNVSTTTAPAFFEQAPTLLGGVPDELDSAAEDCSTGIALASQEGTGDIFLADLKQAVFTTGTPGTWTSGAGERDQSFPEFAALSAGTSGIAVAAGSHIAEVSGEFDAGNAFGAIQLPSTSGSGSPAVVDYIECKVPNDPSGPWSFGQDPHTSTAYTSPNSGDAIALFANLDSTTSVPTFLAVVDMTKLLNPTIVPRVTNGFPTAHTCDPTVDLVAAGVVSFVAIP